MNSDLILIKAINLTTSSRDMNSMSATKIIPLEEEE
jgi:hypothetical protein